MSEVVLHAPFAGWLGRLEDVPDPVFAERMMGGGLAIDPTEGTLRAPADGIVVNLPPTRHAVTLKLDNGADVLLHIGLETVALGGAGFHAHVSVGQTVRRGDPLIDFDLDAVALAAKDLVTPIVLPGEAVALVRDGTDRVVSAGDPIGRVRLTEADGEAEGAGEVLHRVITVTAPHGLHARPAARIVALLKSFDADVSLAIGERTASGRSTVALLAIGARFGDQITVTARGSRADAALDALEKFAAERFGDDADADAVDIKPASTGAVGASPGLAIGHIRQFRLQAIDVVEVGQGIAHETGALDRALRDVATAHSGAGVAASIAEAHRAMLNDPELRGSALSAIAEGRSAGAAWRSAIDEAAAALESTGDARLAERVADLRDLERQVLTALTGASTPALTLTPDTILVAEDLLPSHFLTLDRTKLAGICTAAGGPTAHVAILAAAAGVPMIVAAGGDVLDYADGALAVLDADAARVIVAPTREQLDEAERRAATMRARRAAAARAAHDLAATADGTRIKVFANLGSIDDAEAAVDAGAEGCGLLRTEFLFLDRAAAPDEAEQRELYGLIAATLGDRPLIIRTLDIGGDKPVPYLPSSSEENPALGLRGIRLTRARPDLFATQLRAILSAVPGGQCRIMLPMVVDVAELLAARAMLASAMAEVGRTESVELGVMIETPAAAVLADQLAEHADFLSIGTNDLTQYALAADRGNAAVSSMVDALHPAVLRLIRSACDGAAKHGRWVGVCGSLASEPNAAPLLVGLGVTELSAVPSAVPAVKAAVRATTLAEAKTLAERAVASRSAAEVRALLDEAAA